MSWLNSPQVITTEHVTTDVPPDCENCGAECAGVNGIYWDAQDEPVGLLNVCDDGACLRYAIRTASDDAQVGSVIRREVSVYPYALEAAA
ncbi:hypothetical protein [Saccharopolyspora taberi]|uniref:Uncharacterized protein n=1 Tax=Saccharopolyspora taberi TaxID=60895 RepID=A0ABN3V0C9_9PSEU